ncbi:hypothetical protein [Candidatus Enterococcus ferrettii]|uniref:Uncharacterized protein n=1 Tax=Candidatus Enterococcus ferrettii TaxID=2815324 RepID=A0ABV0EKG7_9ENTE|nr:hypothetical protein [Enterococcus sp. 665A]
MEKIGSQSTKLHKGLPKKYIEEISSSDLVDLFIKEQTDGKGG